MEHIPAMRPGLEVEIAEIICQYRELILAVGNKYPGETRHQTAFRYIRQAEQKANQKANEVVGTIAHFKAQENKHG